MLYAGTSGWAYPSWKPGFYPAKLASAKFLNHYATRLNTVEVNYTFRRFPTEKLLRGWIEATPPNFKFAIKAHQKITHVARLRDVADFTSDFLRALQPLDQEKKLGPVLFQLPPFLKCDVALLKNFLTTLPKPLRATFEFRHESWFSEEVYAVLRSGNAGCADHGFCLSAPTEREIFGQRAQSAGTKNREASGRWRCVRVLQARRY